MRLGVGIDFGTTNSTAAVFDGERLDLVALEDGGPIMPSATYIDRALKASVGQQAIDRYLAGNAGRTVEFIPEVIGTESEIVQHGDSDNPAPLETASKAIYGKPLLDSGLKGRLFRGLKRLLGDGRTRRLMVFDHPFRVVALITPMLLHIRRRIGDAGVERCARAHVGHPVNFEGREPQRNRRALARLAEACRHAGLSDQRPYAEPVAAAVRYLRDQPRLDGERLLTVDFGGGTLDFCVLRRQGARFEVATTHGVALGGDHIDQLLFRALLFPLLGKGELWRRRGMSRDIETRFPFEDYEQQLLNWTIGYTLNQNRYTTAVMDCIAQGGPGERKFGRLHELIRRNLGYLAFQSIRAFKAELSVALEAELDIPEIDVRVPLTRGQFEALIAEPLAAFAAALDETLARAGIEAADVDVVLRTGGSNLIPAVRRILDERFPGRVVEQDPFTSVAAGLAIADYCSGAS